MSLPLPFLSCVQTTPCDDGKCGNCVMCIIEDVEKQQGQEQQQEVSSEEVNGNGTVPQEVQNAQQQLQSGGPNPASARTIKATNGDQNPRSNSGIGAGPAGTTGTPKIQKLGLNRQESVKLFAKPTLVRGATDGTATSSGGVVGGGSTNYHSNSAEDSYRNFGLDIIEENPMTRRRNQMTSIYETVDNGEDAAFEVDYEAGSVFSNKIDPQSAGGFVGGDFTSGKVKEIELKSKAFIIKFSIDSAILAVGLSDGFGVELYETNQFQLIHTIERTSTVSAIDWVDADSSSVNGDNESGSEGRMSKNGNEGYGCQLLAVGSFDGSVKVYAINIHSSQDFVTLVDSFQVSTAVYSMSFVKDKATDYAPHPLAIAIGDQDGMLTFANVGEYLDMSKNKERIRVLDSVQSPILSLAFGFVENGIIVAYGSRDGKVRANLIKRQSKNDEWRVAKRLFILERQGAIRALCFNHDATTLVVGGYDKTLLFINTILWKIVRELDVDGTVQTVEFDPYNRYLLLGSRSKVMTVVDTSTLHPIKTFSTPGWVTSISWGGHSIIAMRSDDRIVSLILFAPIQPLGSTLISSNGEDCSISWSADGRFLARTFGRDVLIADSKKNFETIANVSDVADIDKNDVARCVRFCCAEGKQDLLATVGSYGYLRVVSLRVSVGKIHQQMKASVFVEKQLRSVAWSPDGNSIFTGGREMNLHVLNAVSYRKRCEPINTYGRIWMIDSLSQVAFDDVGGYAACFGAAITNGRNICSVFDLEAKEVNMEITRKRTVRCLRYHPTLPVLAIGDGSNEVMIVDLLGERKLASFLVKGRVNSIAFSPTGDFIAVGCDGRTFSIHETITFKIVQEIRTRSMPLTVEFSGTSGQYLATSHSNGEVEIIKLGPLLSVDYTPLGRVSDIPDWALNEVVYRSPEGPSFLQRCILDGSKESIVCADSVLRVAPESVLTFDRTTGVGCFETAVELRKPNIMRLIMTPVVDGSLDSRSEWSSSLLTTTIPIDGFLTLRDLILHHPPGFAIDLLSKMTFTKVPFSSPRQCNVDDIKECGSSSFIDPWVENEKSIKKKSSFDKVESIRTFNISGFESKNDKKDIVLIPAVLPMPGLGTLDFLSALLSIPDRNVFDNDAMGLVLLVLWKAGIRRYFLIDFTLNIAFNISWILFVDKTASSTASQNNETLFVTSLAWIVLSLNVFFIGEQSLRFSRRRGHYFRSSWHFVEAVCVLLVLIYTIMVLITDNDDKSIVYVSNAGTGNVALAVSTTLVLTLKFVSLLRGFEKTNWLVAVLIQNFIDVRGFLIVILSILMGFTVAFRLLLAEVPGECKVELEDENVLANDCDGDPFGTVSRSFLSTFELTIMGSYENAILYESKDVILAAVVFVIAVTVVLVVALNALIAVLGDSYARVQENLTANRRWEQAELIVEYLAMIPQKQRRNIEHNNQYFHALLASDGHGDLLLHKDDWQGGLNALRRELTEITENNNVLTQNAIEQLRNDLTEEFGSIIHTEVTSVLNNLSLELREMSKFRQNSLRTRKVANAAQKVAQTAHGGKLNFFDGIMKNVSVKEEDSSAGSGSSSNGFVEL